MTCRSCSREDRRRFTHPYRHWTILPFWSFPIHSEISSCFALPGQELPQHARESFSQFASKLFDTSDFMPRWHCGSWTAALGWMHIISDLLIFACYTAIPVCMVVLLLRRRDFPLRPIYWLFACFILSCGSTHLVDATMFYSPAYRLLGIMKIITAAVSTITVVALAIELPKALRIPSLLKSKDELERQASELAATVERLHAERSNLEERSASLTARDRRLRTSLVSARAAAVHWEVDTGHLLWDVGLSDLIFGLEAMPAKSWSELVGTEQAERLRGAARRAAAQHERLVIEIPLEPKPDLPSLVRIRAEVEVRPGEPIMAFGMIGSIS